MQFGLNVSSENIKTAWVEKGERWPSFVMLEVPDSDLGPELRRLWTGQEQRLTDTKYFRIPNKDSVEVPPPVATSPTMTADELLPLLIAYQRELQAAHDKQKAECIAYAQAYLARWTPEAMQARADAPSSYGKRVELHELWGDALELLPGELQNELRAHQSAFEKIGQAAEAKAKAAAAQRNEAEKAAREKERLDWIAGHGSERLKKLAARGIEHDRTYREERRALERPGWAPEGTMCGNAKPRANATETELDALTAAENSGVTDARLMWLNRGPKSTHREDCPLGGEYNDDPSCECEDGESEAILQCEFLGEYLWRKIA